MDHIIAKPTAEDLETAMDFDHVILVNSRRELETKTGLYAPDLSQYESADGVWTEELESSGDWKLLGGFSGQDRYSGPMMHASETISGGLASHILDNPGFYVALVPFCTDRDGNQVDADSWAVAYMPLTETEFPA